MKTFVHEGQLYVNTGTATTTTTVKKELTVIHSFPPTNTSGLSLAVTRTREGQLNTRAATIAMRLIYARPVSERR
jgi:hypothetical protein